MAAHIGVRRMALADVCPGLEDTLLIGIIIGSQNSRTVTIRKDLSLRGVWNFTFRDSEADFVNVTVWGTPAYIDSCTDKFHVGDVVSITNAKIAFRVTGGSEDTFRPEVSSPFQLTLTEGSSEMQHHDLPDAPSFMHLLHIPTRQSLDTVPVRDINSNGNVMQGNFVNLLVAVQNVQRVRQIKMQDGRQVECREVTVFDCTGSGLSLQLWEKELIYQASQWKSRETILYAVDIRMKWNNFRNSCIPTVTSKTIITVDPQVPDAECLRVYAHAAPLQATAIIDYLASNIVDAGTIRNVLSVRAVLSRAWADLNKTMSDDEQQFTALIYAAVTHLDLHHENVVVTKCTSCNKMVSGGNSCVNPECAVEQGSEMFVPLRVFNIRINLSDHTGTLKNCRLTADAAELVLGCTAPQFDSMSSDQKILLKWNLLLEHCAARILVLKASHERRQPYISLVSCNIADLAEVASRLPVL
ncbi:hypothetical protein ONE63_002149 [Megalurothrips usitatus]|uniref:MEIOB-like N-terminal domain-containing protein n=1 Tax=Megalurothrips usitatus TaxID=439358 RepID=A0AAV7XEC5_9NEOP|nr:hypothetical protein ONE63_002149 [Megalurothrips usitatus]